MKATGGEYLDACFTFVIIQLARRLYQCFRTMGHYVHFLSSISSRIYDQTCYLWAMAIYIFCKYIYVLVNIYMYVILHLIQKYVRLI